LRDTESSIETAESSMVELQRHRHPEERSDKGYLFGCGGDN
jgi:hypothetical protein